MVNQLVSGRRLVFLRSKFEISVPDLVGIHCFPPWNRCLSVFYNSCISSKMPNLTKKGWHDKGWSFRVQALVLKTSRDWTFANPNMLKELLYGSGKMPARSGRLWSFLVLSVLIYSTFWVLFIMQVEYVFCRLLHGDQCKSKKNPIWEIAHFLVFFQSRCATVQLRNISVTSTNKAKLEIRKFFTLIFEWSGF